MGGRGDLEWAVEEACSNAWPSPRQVFLDGWLVRIAGGPTRWTNSVNPLRTRSHDPSHVIEACERLYAARGQNVIFRVPSLATGMDMPLHRRGYTVEEDVRTLYADLTGVAPPVGAGVQLRPTPDETWLAARSGLTRAGSNADRSFRAMTTSILLPTAFASVAVEGAVASVAYGAVDRSLLVIESVVTDVTRRDQGLARSAVSRLMQWGRENAAVGACLQVAADNAPARALYARLGFERELYRYHYRRCADDDRAETSAA